MIFKTRKQTPPPGFCFGTASSNDLDGENTLENTSWMQCTECVNRISLIQDYPQFVSNFPPFQHKMYISQVVFPCVGNFYCRATELHFQKYLFIPFIFSSEQHFWLSSLFDKKQSSSYCLELSISLTALCFLKVCTICFLETFSILI